MKIYLAIPYSGIEELSFKIANEVTALLMSQGHIVYSPISSNHPIAVAHGLPTGWDFWEKFDTEFIDWADEVRVVDIHGLVDNAKALRSKSKGVQGELRIANRLGKVISTHHYHYVKS